MAHECPECYSSCHCGGDFDDIDFGQSDDCRHYRSLECSGHREYCSNEQCPCRKWRDEDDYKQEDDDD